MNVRVSTRHLVPILLGAAILLLAGCSTINSRIRGKAVLFESLPVETQEKIRKGTVEVGYTPDMVFIAMGEPHEKRRIRSANRDGMTWVYNVYFQDWVGRVLVGHRRIVVRDEENKIIRVYHEPVYQDVYRDRKEERIRIIFEDGAVSVIEQRER